MHILIGLALAVALLYFWLIGHWFARILAFLMFAAILGLLGASIGNTADASVHGAPVVMALIGVGLAWPVAALPAYYWRRRARLFLDAHGGGGLSAL
jgi:lipoprotein signal peptidase